MSKAQEMRDQSPEDLLAMYGDLQRELYQLRNQSKQERAEKPHRILEVRKNIARALTILTQKNVKL